MIDTNFDLSKLLSAVREVKLSIEEISYISGIPESIFYQFLGGLEVPDFEVLQRLSFTLGVPVKELGYIEKEDKNELENN